MAGPCPVYAQHACMPHRVGEQEGKKCSAVLIVNRPVAFKSVRIREQHSSMPRKQCTAYQVSKAAWNSLPIPCLCCFCALIFAFCKCSDHRTFASAG